MSKPYVRRKDIELSEEQETFEMFANSKILTTWVATLNGNLSTGEEVSMSRDSASAGEALLLLTEAIEAQGWEIR